ncbi:Ankyrin repeat and SOCS box protein 10 [Diplodia intermedia]|uniref:Ankyrin repeat and SOCS box protein 10 n=1 Tax=Diplodia intermedia TaxID=856260 RepID=A0ABR3TJ23_9PEZI
MDPATVLSMAGACLTLVSRTVTDVNDIVGKYRKKKLSLIAARLGTIKATISQLETWLRNEGGSAITPEIDRDLRDAMGACSVVVTGIQLYVTNVRQGWLGGKFRYLWEESQFLQFSSALDSQIAALGLFVNVILLYSMKISNGSSSSPTAESSSFTFDDELIDSETYRATFRRVMTLGTRKEIDSIGGENQIVGEALSSGTSSSAVTSTASAVSDSRNSDALTMTTVSTDSTASTSSTRSYSIPNADWKKTASNRSWSSRAGKQSRILVKDLCLAAAQGDTSMIESLYSKGADVNGRHEIFGLSPKVPKEEQGVAVKSIFRHGSSSSRADRTPLHYAAENGHADAIRVLIARGADPNSKTKGGMISLHIARGGSETAETLIALGAKMLATDDSGATPLHALAAAGQTDGVKALLAAKCPVDIADKAQRTPLHLACRRSDNRDVVSSLLSAGAYANAADADGVRPLHEACGHGNAELIPLLTAAGADVEAPAKDLWHPLHYAAAHDPPSSTPAAHAACITTLLRLSAAPTAPTAHGDHALHLAAAAANLAAVAALLAAGAPVDAANADGERPLHMALQPQPQQRQRYRLFASTSPTAAIVRLLLEHGADATAGNKKGGTPLVIVCGTLMMTMAMAAVLPLVETLLELGGGGGRGEVAGRALLAACEGGWASGRHGGGGKENGSRGNGGGGAQGGALLDVVRLLVGPRGGARPTHEVFRALWRNGRVGIWGKRAVHAVLNEVAEPGLRRDEAEWLIVAL